MSELSPRLALPFLQPAQAQKHVTHNEALARLDLLVQLSVQGFEAVTPPASPQEGQIWALAAAPSGVWADHGGHLAVWRDAAWQFILPQPGWQASLAQSAAPEWRIFTDQGWVVPLPEMLDNLAGLGVNTSHDATNRLAVAAPATLLSHDGAGHQLKINKAAPADTASLLFQTGWAGRAEMGTAGTDDFAIKVSADGAIWHDGLVVDRASGKVALPEGATIAGTEAYRRGNILGTVSQSGGVPTGAVIESDSNANGSYVKFADGTMVTRTRFTITGSTTIRLIADVTLPAAFASTADMHPQLTLPTHSASALIGVARTNIESWGCAQPGGSGTFTTTQIGCSVFCKNSSVQTDPPATIDDMYLTVTGRWF